MSKSNLSRFETTKGPAGFPDQAPGANYPGAGSTRQPVPSSHNRTCHCPHTYCICGDHPKFDRPECPRCHGSGEIGFNNSPINDPQCAEEAICNVCHGEGVVTALEAQAYELGWMEDDAA